VDSTTSICETSIVLLQVTSPAPGGWSNMADLPTNNFILLGLKSLKVVESSIKQWWYSGHKLRF